MKYNVHYRGKNSIAGSQEDMAVSQHGCDLAVGKVVTTSPVILHLYNSLT